MKVTVIIAVDIRDQKLTQAKDYGSYEEICDALRLSMDGIIQTVSMFRR